MEPVRDHGSFANVPLWDDDVDAHHTDRWQHHAMYVGLRLPQHHRRRHHRRHHERGGGSSGSSAARKMGQQQDPPRDKNIEKVAHEPPSQRVQFILGMTDDDGSEVLQTHDVFCQMDELRHGGDDNDIIWKEAARWIKFEEDVEEGGERWSKPHVATLSLHSLFELRKGIMSGTVMLDVDANNLSQLVDLMMDNMVASKQLEEKLRDQVSNILLRHHHHQHDKREGRTIPLIRSLAEIGKRSSDKHIEDKGGASAPNLHASGGSAGSSVAERSGNSLRLPGSSLKKALRDMKPSNNSAGTMSKNLSDKDLKKAESGEVTDGHSSSRMYNEHFFKKIPHGAETANILVGEVNFLTYPIIAFVRLQRAQMLGDLTEVPVPTRFMFILLGPMGDIMRYREIGRSIGTLMSDEVFHDVAYKAKNREDLLSAIDEFLDQVTVLPPGEWDPSIRIEPPKSIPSQEPRKTHGVKGRQPPGLSNGLMMVEDVVDGGGGEEHGDHTLIRTGRIFGGLIADVKRKASWYLSDYRDALHPQCLASLFFMYFACLAPIVTFGGLLGDATDNNIAAMESLMSGAVCGISYHLFSGQPLTIIGSTGPVLVFETIVYRVCLEYEFSYLSVRCWIGFWICLILLLMVALDLSALVRYITRFTEESFATLIAVIFIVEAFKKLLHINDKYPFNGHYGEPVDYTCECRAPTSNDTESTAGFVATTTMAGLNLTANGTSDWASLSRDACEDMGGVYIDTGCGTPHYIPDVFFFSCLLFIGTFLISLSLKEFKTMRFFTTRIRGIVSDFAVTLAILFMVLLHSMAGIKTPTLEVPEEFRPTLPTRGWVVNPFDVPLWVIPMTILPAILATILIFMDQQITAVIVNRKENKLRKGGGYHLDLLLISLQIGVCSFLGTPWFVAATVLSINHVRSLTRESESAAPGERPKFLGIREQRLTGVLVFIMVGMSGFFSSVLKLIPMSVLYGVFLFMGVSSMVGVQLIQRILIVFMPPKYQPDYMFLRTVPLRRVHMFTAVQVACLAVLWVIKTIKSISIVFPIMVLAMCFVRKSLDWVFTRHELKWLDDIIPESHKREKEEKEIMMMEQEMENILEISGGAVNIPLKDGKMINIPVNCIDYRPVLNISEEMSNTGIWKQLSDTNNGITTSLKRNRRRSSGGIDLNKRKSHKMFDENEESLELETLVVNPEIVVDPPSSTGSATTGPAKSDVKVIGSSKKRT
ncbi:Sodium-driven chloride bicarbonate exchanger [Lamellibrachia satsuma]|nr:Sodium-driven chloride bicarbonate exchanger [Lamellibrachia satsuma]